MIEHLVSSTYFDYLDQIANLELKNRPSQQGGTEIRYRSARRHQGGKALTGLISQAFLDRRNNSPAILVTGTGNPVWLPHGETDGPSGVAILARTFASLGISSCVLAEEQFLPGIRAAVRAAGTPLLSEASWQERNNGALCLPFPTGRNAAAPFVDTLLSRSRGWSSVFFIEKPGPSTEGHFHNSSGVQKDPDWVAHVQMLAVAAQQHGLLTIGIGDGGNEIGFGAIREALHTEYPHRFGCTCGCATGLLDSTVLDFLFPASVSNWGAYAVAASLALRLGNRDLMPDWTDIERSIRAPIEHGAFDGYTGLAVASVDGVSPRANRAVYHLLEEVVQLALTENAHGSGTLLGR